jgi:L-serine/L-threonine ammonia-lyase
MTPLHIRTPLLESRPLSSHIGTDVRLKLECVQPSGSFKIRGLGRACQLSHADGASALVASSGGNAGLAVAYAGRQLGLPVKIVVPETTSGLMQDRLRSLGAEVVQHGAAWDDSHERAQEIAAQSGAAYIHPFDDPRIWEGHASLIHEVRDEGFTPDAVVTVVGGGGLLCGVLQGLHDVGWSKVPVMTVETSGAASFAQSVQAGRRVTLDRISSLATSLGARTVCQRALDWTREHEVRPYIIEDRSAVQSVLRFADDHRFLVEPACGAALAAVYDRLPGISTYGKLLVIVCGGAGVTRDLIEKWKRQVGLAS